MPGPNQEQHMTRTKKAITGWHQNISNPTRNRASGPFCPKAASDFELPLALLLSEPPRQIRFSRRHDAQAGATGGKKISLTKAPPPESVRAVPLRSGLMAREMVSAKDSSSNMSCAKTVFIVAIMAWQPDASEDNKKKQRV